MDLAEYRFNRTHGLDAVGLEDGEATFGLWCTSQPDQIHDVPIADEWDLEYKYVTCPACGCCHPNALSFLQHTEADMRLQNVEFDWKAH